MAEIAYGFQNLKSLFTKRVQEVGVQIVSLAIQATVAEHERQISALMGLFVTKTTKGKTRFKTHTNVRSQPLDESGRARPIEWAGYYDVGYPMQMAGSAWGANFITLEKMTVQEANDNTVAMVNGDMFWVRDQILSALTYPTAWTYTDPDDDLGSLTILPLANGDTQEYLIKRGAEAGAIDNHYLYQLAAIADNANPFPEHYEEIFEHAENSGDLVTLVPTNRLTTVEALTNFSDPPDPNIRPGANTAVLTGRLGVAVPGEVVGYTDKNWIVHWRSLPDDFIISVPTGGERPLAMREEPEESLRGFRERATRADYPFWEKQYFRRAGFGGWNRVGALVRRMGVSEYTPPTIFASKPLP